MIINSIVYEYVREYQINIHTNQLGVEGFEEEISQGGYDKV